jgi:hypothetical protein
MKWENALDELLAEANPSIKYRIYRDILKESQSMKMERFYAEVLQDPQVKYAFSLQSADGYFGDVFHAGFIPKGSHYGKFGTEGIMRFLFEKGIEPSDPRIRAGLEALRRDSWLGQEKGIWCVYYKDIGMYGPEFIRTALLSMFGFVSDTEMKPFICDTIKTFEDLYHISSYDSMIEDFKYGGRCYKVYKKGVRFPEYYHLKMLAFSDLWRTEENQLRVIAGVKRLVEFSPLQEVRVKYKARWLAPGSIRPFNLKVDLGDLAAAGWIRDNWEQWFMTFEHFARMGIVKCVPELNNQASQLFDLLEEGKGFFPLNLKEEYFNRWGAYLGLALENNWKNGRARYDLTFRSLLILSYAGLLESSTVI